MFVIGLTGGVATGKTLAAQYFKKLGAKVFDADRSVHALLESNKTCIRQIKQAFGENVVSNGRVRRDVLAKIVFSDAKALKRLERIVHPLVRQDMQRFLKDNKNTTWVVLDIPLLFETNYWRSTDINIVVKANQQLQIKRIMNRIGITRAEAIRRIQAQMPMSQKIHLADEVIDNRGTKKQLEKQVKAIYIKYISKK